MTEGIWHAEAEYGLINEPKSIYADLYHLIQYYFDLRG